MLFQRARVTYYSRTMTISCWSSNASCRFNSFGWWSWFMIPISFLTVFLSVGYGVLINLATNVLPVAFSTARWTTPKAPLQHNAQMTSVTNAVIERNCKSRYQALSATGEMTATSASTSSLREITNDAWARSVDFVSQFQAIVCCTIAYYQLASCNASTKSQNQTQNLLPVVTVFLIFLMSAHRSADTFLSLSNSFRWVNDQKAWNLPETTYINLNFTGKGHFKTFVTSAEKK